MNSSEASFKLVGLQNSAEFFYIQFCNVSTVLRMVPKAITANTFYNLLQKCYNIIEWWE